MMEWGHLPPHHVSQTRSGLAAPSSSPGSMEGAEKSSSRTDTPAAGAFCQLRVPPSLPAFPLSAVFWVNALAYDPSLEQVPDAVSTVPRAPGRPCWCGCCTSRKRHLCRGRCVETLSFCGILQTEGPVFSRSQNCFVKIEAISDTGELTDVVREEKDAVP